MRAFLATVICMVILGCTTTPSTNIAPQTEYWTSTVFTDAVRNFLVLQLSGDQALMLIYFPNPDDEPTICRQAGSAARSSPQSLQISVSHGLCENGRQMGAAEFNCQNANSNELECAITGGPVLNFTREQSDRYRVTPD